MAELERHYTGGRSIGTCFDLVAGTSTGGILALGLGAGLSATQLRDLYVNRGNEVFPPYGESPVGRLRRWTQRKLHYARYLYDRDALQRMLHDTLGDRLFGQSSLRLCIPAFDGGHSEVFVFKTPHHPDYKTDRFERMVNVALATAAAPSYFRPMIHGGYTLVDGGVWANNPVMLAVIEALTCFDVTREQIQVLTLGCGEERYVVSRLQILKGGLWHWKDIMSAAMRLQSLAATNQARLLLGPPAVVRVDAPMVSPAIQMDDWRRSVTELVPAAINAVADKGEEIARTFLHEPAAPYTPVSAP